MALLHFDQKSFDAALAEGKLMMVDFWANWCMPCRMLGPVIEQLAQDYEGKAVIGKVDVDEQGELAMRYGVMSIPTVIFFKDGKEIHREVAPCPRKCSPTSSTRTCNSGDLTHAKTKKKPAERVSFSRF